MIKTVIRGIPADFPIEKFKQISPRPEFPVHSVHRLCHRDGSPLMWRPTKNGQAVPPLPVIRSRGRQLSCGPALREMPPFGPENAPYPRVRREPSCLRLGILTTSPIFRNNHPLLPLSPRLRFFQRVGKSKPALPPRAAPGPSGEAVRRAPPVSPPTSATAGISSFGEDVQTVMAVLRAVSSSEISEFARDLRACRSVDEKLLVLVRYHHLMATYNYERTGRTLVGGTALYYSRSLHCCPIDIPPLINMEATGCRLAMTGHHTLIIVSVYLPSPNRCTGATLSPPCLRGCRHPLWPSTIDIALTKGVPKFKSERHYINLRPTIGQFVKMGPPDGGRPNPTCKITDWKRVSTALEKIDTPPLNSIPDNIRDRRNRLSDRLDGSTALDDAEVAECLADSIETQCSPSSAPTHINRIEEEVLQNLPRTERRSDACLTQRSPIAGEIAQDQKGGRRWRMSVLTRPDLNQRTLKAPPPPLYSFHNDARPASNSRFSQMTPRFITRVGIEPPFNPPPESH
ncbi:hypothetical protein EVAR_69042_1 [Eumeta japonica]|uniref:Uncharacterized protein n=1 Tax=Eumeta variegata TaxID=151549 RepID=A0A4C1ZGI2_EUMVA|nr:hypothetical protein EVAR_69042_1 [Eumeta japonica]